MDDGGRQRKRSALLMNALVFPGAGYFLIGKRTRGFVIMTLTTTLLLIPIIAYVTAFRHALTHLSLHDPLLSQSLSAMGHAWDSVSTIVWLSLAGMVIIWISGIVDILRQK